MSVLRYPSTLSNIPPGQRIHHRWQRKTCNPACRETAVQGRETELALGERKGEEGENDGEDAAQAEAFGHGGVRKGQAIEFDG